MGVTAPPPIKVAIVGAGNMAREHARAFRGLPGVELAGIASRTRSKAEVLAAEHGIARVCGEIDELYEKTKADLVVITVFELAMQAVAVACFKYPWAALLEKPAGYTVPIAEAIADAARRERRKAYVALNRRFYSSTRQSLERLATIAGPRYVRVQDQQDATVARQLGHPDEVARNWMYANSIHLVDYFSVFARGEVAKVTRLVEWDERAPGVVLAKMDFDGGDVGYYEGLWNGPGPWAVSVATPGERIELRPLEQGNFQLRGERKVTPFEIDRRDADFKAGFRLQAEHAVRAVRGEPNDLPDLDAALKSMRLVREIFASAR